MQTEPCLSTTTTTTTSSCFAPEAPSPQAFQKALHQTLFNQKLNIPKTCNIKSLSHQTHFTPNSLYTRCRKPFTPRIFDLYTTNNWTPKPEACFTRNNSCFTSTVLPQKFLHQRNFTPQAFTPKALSTRNVLQHKPFAPKTFYTKHPNFFYTRIILHHTLFHPAPVIPFYNRNLFHHKPFMPKTFYGSSSFTPEATPCKTQWEAKHPVNP